MERIVSFVDANERLRMRAKQLLGLGLRQNFLARKMGIPPSTFNKWIHEDPKYVPPVTALENLAAFEAEWMETLKETQREHVSTAGSLQPTGTDGTDRRTRVIPVQEDRRQH